MTENNEEGAVLLFDLEVKESRRDLSGRDRLLDQVERCLQAMPITVLVGPRGWEIPPLLKTALNELNHPYVYIDASALEESGYAKFNLTDSLKKAFTHTLHLSASGACRRRAGERRPRDSGNALGDRKGRGAVRDKRSADGGKQVRELTQRAVNGWVPHNSHGCE